MIYFTNLSAFPCAGNCWAIKGKYNRSQSLNAANPRLSIRVVADRLLATTNLTSTFPQRAAVSHNWVGSHCDIHLRICDVPYSPLTQKLD